MSGRMQHTPTEFTFLLQLVVLHLDNTKQILSNLPKYVIRSYMYTRKGAV